MQKFSRANQPKSAWRGRTISIGLAAAAAAIMCISTSLPASAAEVEATNSSSVVTPQAYAPFFTIFYSPGCKGASRTYSGTNSGEAWISDRFNDTSSGTAGATQLIRNNAASITVSQAYVGVSNNNGAVFQGGFPAAGCKNFTSDLRNKNTYWYTDGRP